MVRKVSIGVKHIPEMIGRPVWYGGKVGIVRSLDHTKLYVQFEMSQPIGISANKLYIACKNWDDTIRKKCKGHVEPFYETDMCEKCGLEHGAAMRRRDNDWG